MIFIVVKFPVRPDKADEWEKLATEYAGGQQRGRLLVLRLAPHRPRPQRVGLHRGLPRPGRGRRHVSSAAFKNFVEVAPDLVSAQPKIINTTIEQRRLGPHGGDQAPATPETRGGGRPVRSRALRHRAGAGAGPGARRAAPGPQDEPLDVVRLPAGRRPGSSPTAQHYAISGLDEARAYLAHPVLGPRLVECAELVAAVEGGGAARSSATPTTSSCARR